MDRQILEAKDISFSYNNEPVLKDISLKFCQGKFYGILGPNGSGKSTLLDILMGYKFPDRGRVLLYGKEIRSLKKSEIAKRISYVPQSFSVNFPFTVDEIITMGRYPYVKRFSLPSIEDIEIVREVERKVDVFDLRKKLITELSGGEKQRVMIARALAQDTPIFLLDEPTSNLDIKHSLKILSIFKKNVIYKRSCVICVFHNINEATSFCDELIFLKQGKVIESGPSSKVISEDILKEVFEVDVKLRFEERLNCYQVLFLNGGFENEK
ncbi:ABC transporter ATP-binding protein [Desulfothermus okinawensis]